MAVVEALRAIPRPCSSPVLIQSSLKWIILRLNDDLPRWKAEGNLLVKNGKPLSNRKMIPLWEAVRAATEGLTIIAEYVGEISLAPAEMAESARDGGAFTSKAEAAHAVATRDQRRHRARNTRRVNERERGRYAEECALRDRA